MASAHQAVVPLRPRSLGLRPRREPGPDDRRPGAAQALQRVHALILAGKLRSPRDPKSLLYISMLFREHADTIAAASPPQRALMGAMAAVGRLLGLELPPRRS